MVYIGITIEIEEALRLFKMDESFVKSYYDTEPINNYLKEFGSSLDFVYLDKGVCVLGLLLKGDKHYHPSMIGIEDGLREILQLTKKFREEIKNLRFDLSAVTIAQMESEPIVMHNPDPFLILCS
jgi:hypothetical protein